MKQPSIPTEAHYVNQKVDIEHEVQSDFAIRYYPDSSRTESLRSYLVGCA